MFFLFPIVFMLVSSVKNYEMQVLRDMSSLRAFLPISPRFYRLDQHALNQLLAEHERQGEPFPQEVADNLSKMMLFETTREENFIQTLEERIGKEPANQYKDIILTYADQTGIGVQNYQDVFGQMPFKRFILNSVFIVSTIVIFGLMINSLIAYALARLRFAGRGVLLTIIIALIIIPLEAVVVPLLLIVNRFGWLDSYHVQIIPFIADPFSIFLFYQFFIGLPKDMEEAALVDGASLFGIYWKIVLPLSRPVFATVAILQFLLHWNDFLWPLMVTRGETYRPLMVAIQQFFSQDPKVWGDIMAFASMITIPVLFVFLLFQKWFVQSVATTGVKG
jgi:multiple sugar transport system permease protein